MSGKQDCEKVMNSVLPLAQRMLKQSGEFYPYGGFMKLSGEIVHVGAKDGQDAKRIAVALQSPFAAICENDWRSRRIRLSDLGCSTIQICLDHVDGYSAEVFLPYKIDQGSQVMYAAMFAQQGKKEIFK